MNYGASNKKLKGLKSAAKSSVPSMSSGASGRLQGLKSAAKKDVPSMKSAAKKNVPSLKSGSESFKSGLKSAAAKAKIKSKIGKKKENYNAVSEKGVKFTFDKSKFKTPQQQAEALDKKTSIKDKVKKLKLDKFNKVKNGRK